MRREEKWGDQLPKKAIYVRVGELLVTLTILFFLVPAGWAQMDRAGLAGTVTDAFGRVLPGVRVVAVQVATGLQREAVSSGSGVYALPELPVGTYQVTFGHEGFQSLRFEDVVERLEQTRTLNATLQVAGKKEVVEVLASPQSLDQTTNTLGTEIERVQGQELPLNGQNWATLTALIPAAVDTAGGPGAGNQRSIRYAGRGRDDNNYTYDGIDATNIINQSQQYYVRAAIPLDTIEEVRVDPLLATAQAGGRAGANWPSLPMGAPISSMETSTTFCATTFSMPPSGSTL